MIRIARFSGFSAAVVVLVATIGWMLFVNTSTTVAFGDVVEKVRKAKSLTMIYHDGPERPVNGDQVKGLPNLVVRVSAQGQKIRMNMADKVVSIVDFEKKKGVAIMHERKTAFTYSMSDGDVKAMKADAYYQPIEKFSMILPKDARQLESEQLDGKTVHVYAVAKCEPLKFDGAGEMRVWVDPKSRLPLKIRIGRNTRRNSKPTDRPFDTITTYDEMVWNKSLDAKLFDLQIPDGYQVKEGLPN